VQALLPSIRPERLRRQEVALIQLNLSVLAGIALVHALFAPALGTPPPAFFIVLGGRFGMQALELLWLQGLDPGDRRVLALYSHAAIVVNLGVAFLLSYLAGLPDSHYVVLTVVPVLAAAFRYRAWAVALVVAAAGGLTFGEVALLPRHVNAASEYFEAASVVLIYAMIATVVATLARDLREQQAATERHLEQLETTRDQLMREERLGAVGRLAGALAHEIRNPVAMIVSSLGMSGHAAASGLERAELDAIIREEAARLERLTADFLDFARQRPPSRRPTSLATALGYVAGLAQARLAEARLAVRVDCPAGLEASIDPYQIHQALLNLLLNAIAVAPPGSTIVLHAAAADGRIRIAVENAGPPIDAADTERIFEPFVSSRPGGSGLGLAITRNIARAHGGDVVLERNQPGGVRFTLDLPLALPQEAAVGAHPDR